MGILVLFLVMSVVIMVVTVVAVVLEKKEEKEREEQTVVNSLQKISLERRLEGLKTRCKVLEERYIALMEHLGLEIEYQPEKLIIKEKEDKDG